MYKDATMEKSKEEINHIHTIFCVLLIFFTDSADVIEQVKNCVSAKSFKLYHDAYCITYRINFEVYCKSHVFRQIDRLLY